MWEVLPVGAPGASRVGGCLWQPGRRCRGEGWAASGKGQWVHLPPKESPLGTAEKNEKLQFLHILNRGRKGQWEGHCPFRSAVRGWTCGHLLEAGLPRVWGALAPFTSVMTLGPHRPRWGQTGGCGDLRLTLPGPQPLPLMAWVPGSSAKLEGQSWGPARPGVSPGFQELECHPRTLADGAQGKVVSPVCR